MKICRVCRIGKDQDFFCKDKSEKDGLNSSCKICAKQQQKRWMNNPINKSKKIAYGIKYRSKPEYQEKRHKYNTNHRNRDRRTQYDRVRHYGLKVYEINIILLMQENKCAICKKDFINNKFHVDHNHYTGKVREFLCHKCNLGLGHFYENINILKNAIIYLEKHLCVNQ